MKLLKVKEMKIKGIRCFLQLGLYVSFLPRVNYRYKKGEKMFEAKNHSLNF